MAKKLKTVGKVLTVIYSLAGLVLGIIMFSIVDDILLFIPIGIVVGLFVAWVWRVLLYAFSELVESTKASEKYLSELGKILSDDLQTLKVMNYNQTKELVKFHNDLSSTQKDIENDSENINGQP